MGNAIHRWRKVSRIQPRVNGRMRGKDEEAKPQFEELERADPRELVRFLSERGQAIEDVLPVFRGETLEQGEDLPNRLLLAVGVRSRPAFLRMSESLVRTEMA